MPAIHVENLVKRFGTLTAVDGLSIDIERGECFGLLGPNGAGKTTTLEILEGLQTADGGTVQILGHSWGRDDRHLRQRLGIALQETQLAERHSVLETVRLFRSFYPSGRSVDEVIDMVSLQEKRDTWVSKLSGGQKQRLAIACALVGDPDILFLDEPTTGLDPQSRRQVWDLVVEYKKGGRTVVLTTHYMDEAERLCDRIAVVDHGRVIARGTPDELIAGLGGSVVVELVPGSPLSPGEVGGLPGVCDVREAAGRLVLTVTALHESLPALLAFVEKRGVPLKELATHRATLEDVFVNLTGRHLRDT